MRGLIQCLAMTPPISAYILAKNEENRIADAIKSVNWADEILVIDTGCQDNTKNIAENLGAKVISLPFKGFGQTRNEAIAQCSNDWVFCLDADERCTPELHEEIKNLFNNSSELLSSVFLAPRKNFFLGRWIKYSGWYPDYRHPALFNKKTMRYTDDAVHESYIAITPLRAIYLKHALIHYPYENITHLLNKANLYSTLGVKRLQNKKKQPSLLSALIHATWAFIRQYVLRRGFLDGAPGFILAFNNFQATFFRYAKYWECSQNEQAHSHRIDAIENK